MAEIRFDGRVAVVTGAGGGLGRAHALLLASRGARVVVNDLGGSVDGAGSSRKAADAVVEEIRAAGGEAVASHDSVGEAAGASRIVEAALGAFGKLDIVVNNAGILRDVSFVKMDEAAWDTVVKVHLYGTMRVAKAAWPHLRQNAWGRVVNTTSAAGLYGNFGQASYSAAKMGIVGLSRTLAHEGAKYGIKVNVVAPVAKSRMTETILPPPVLERIRPESVSPVVAYLSSEQCQVTGRIYSVGGGYVSRVAVVEGQGAQLGAGLSPEDVAGQWDVIDDLSDARPFDNATEAAQMALEGAL